MSPLERARKVRHCCTRCGVKLSLSDETNLCEEHRLDVNARMRTSYWRRRRGMCHAGPAAVMTSATGAGARVAIPGDADRIQRAA